MNTHSDVNPRAMAKLDKWLKDLPGHSVVELIITTVVPVLLKTNDGLIN